MAVPKNWFTHLANRSITKVLGVDESFVYTEALDGSKHYAMPIAEYDSSFAKAWRPTVDADLGDQAPPASFRPPANAAEFWDPEPEITA